MNRAGWSMGILFHGGLSVWNLFFIFIWNETWTFQNPLWKKIPPNPPNSSQLNQNISFQCNLFKELYYDTIEQSEKSFSEMDTISWSILILLELCFRHKTLFCQSSDQLSLWIWSTEPNKEQCWPKLEATLLESIELHWHKTCVRAESGPGSLRRDNSYAEGPGERSSRKSHSLEAVNRYKLK